MCMGPIITHVDGFSWLQSLRSLLYDFHLTATRFLPPPEVAASCNTHQCLPNCLSSPPAHVESSATATRALVTDTPPSLTLYILSTMSLSPQAFPLNFTSLHTGHHLKSELMKPPSRLYLWWHGQPHYRRLQFLRDEPSSPWGSVRGRGESSNLPKIKNRRLFISKFVYVYALNSSVVCLLYFSWTKSCLEDCLSCKYSC